jgi:hypothetical protein
MEIERLRRALALTLEVQPSSAGSTYRILSRNLDFESGIGHFLPLAAAPALSYGICPVFQELRYTVPLQIAIKPRAPGILQPRVRQDDCRKSLDSSGNRIPDIFLLLNDADVVAVLSQDVVNAFPARTIRPRTVDKNIFRTRCS